MEPKEKHETNVPRSIGIIIDGNRRWAKENGLSSMEGHKKGSEKIKDIVSWSHEAGVEEMIIYAFSSENWNRGKEEVDYLMKLLEDVFDAQMKELEEQKVRIRFIGERSRLPETIQERIGETEERTKNAGNGTVVFAVSYGGRGEILAGVNRLLEEGREVVTEEELCNSMWSTGLLDPDLIIRTGGEKRLSNFLPWQSVYSELFFTDTKWPAFSKEEFDSILADYSKRERRHGT